MKVRKTKDQQFEELKDTVSRLLPWVQYAIDNNTYQHCAFPKGAEIAVRKAR